MKHTFVNLLALTTLFSINSCNTATKPQPTDATRAEIFHGRPKTLHIATYPAHSNAGEWFKDTTAGQIQHIVNTYNLSGELTSETHAIDDSTTYTIRYEYTAGSPRKATAVRMHDTTELSRTEYRYDKDDRLMLALHQVAAVHISLQPDRLRAIERASIDEPLPHERHGMGAQIDEHNQIQDPADPDRPVCDRRVVL